MKKACHLFLVLNPAAGHSRRDEIMVRLESTFTAPQWQLEVYEITGSEDVAAVTRTARERGANLVVAAGGDGTVLTVANGLINSQVPLGILPLGTGNGLARGMNIPLNLDGALNLLTGEHSVMPIDTLKVNQTYYVLDVSAGISPQLMRDTKTELKKRFGRLAYFWTALRRTNLFRVRRYRLTIDGAFYSLLATEVMIANGTLLEAPTATIGPPETFTDKQLEVYVLTARNLLDYLRLGWAVLRRAPRAAPVVRHFPVKHFVRLDARRRSHLVQADGEVIGHTPITVELIPDALHVIVPPTAVAVPSTAVAAPPTAAAAPASVGMANRTTAVIT